MHHNEFCIILRCSIRHPQRGYVVKRHLLMRFFYHTSSEIQQRCFIFRFWSLHSDLYWKVIHNHKSENSIADILSILKVILWNLSSEKPMGRWQTLLILALLLHCKYFRTAAYVLSPSSSTNMYLARNK